MPDRHRGEILTSNCAEAGGGGGGGAGVKGVSEFLINQKVRELRHLLLKAFENF